MRSTLVAVVAVTILGYCAIAGETSDPIGVSSSSDMSIADLNSERFVFVANRTSAEIAIIDTRIDAVTGQVRVADIPHQFVISGTRAKLVASHLEARAVTVFNLERMEIEAVLHLGFRPEQLELDPSGRTFAFASGPDDRVSVVSLKPVEEMFQLSGLDRPSDLMFSRDTRQLFVASAIAPRIAVVDAWNGDLLEPLVMDQPPASGSARLQYAGQFGFALHGASGAVSVFHLLDRYLIGTLDLPGPTIAAFATSYGRQILVPNERDHSVSIVSLPVRGTPTETTRLPSLPGISGINTGMFDSVAFVLSRDHNKAVVLDLDEHRAVAEIALPSQPETAIAADAGRKLYVALSGSHQVAVIDMQKRVLAKLIDGVGREPWGVNMVGALSYCH